MTIRNKQLIIIAVFAFMALGTGIILLVKNIKNSSTPPRLLPAPSNSPYLYQSINQPFKIYLGDRNNQSQPKVKFQFNGSFAEFTPTKASNGETLFEKPDDKTVVYRNVYPNTDLVYTLTEKGVKEEIVLQRPSALDSASFLELTFNLNLKNVIPRKSLDGQEISYFIDPVSQEYRFHLPKPFMRDAAGNRSEDVQLKILRSSALNSAGVRDYYTISLIPGQEWLASAVYPVTIDPSIVHDTSSEFATGTSNRIQDIGSGASPQLELPYHELTTDIHTAGLWHMNETSGSNVADSSGNGYNGTTTGTTIVTGKLGNARSFASGDYVNLGDIAGADFGTSDFTVEFWFKIADITSNTYIISKRTGCGHENFWNIALLSTGRMSVELDQDASGTNYNNFYSTRSALDDNAWHHVALVRTGPTASFYIDGSFDNSNSTSGTTNLGNTNSFKFGSDPCATNFTGTLDEVRISNSARSPEEIRQDAQRFPYGIHTADTIDLTGGTSVVTGFTSLQWSESGVQTGDGETVYSSTNLVSQWNLNETSGTTAANNGGASSCGGVPANCNGTLTNFANTSGQDVAAGSGWTAVNRKWGAGALMFDGSNDYVTCTDANCGGTSKLDPGTSSFSIEAWFKTASFTGGPVIIRKGDPQVSNDAEYLIDITSANGAVRFCSLDGTTTACMTSSNSYTDSNWHFAVGVKLANNSYKLYVDGQEVASSTTNVTGTIDTAAPFGIGAAVSATTTVAYFNGIIDSARFYSRALGAAEILSNYQAGNIEFQTRTGSTSSPPSGWEEWRPVTAETAILSMDADSANWSTSNSNLLTKADESTIKVEGTGSLKSTVGAPQVDASTVALWHVEETSGTGAYIKDSTVNANHGTPTGTTVTEGFYGKARSFNGTSDYVNVPDSASLSPTSALSAEAWVKQSSASVNKAIIAKWTFSTQGTWAFQTNNDDATSLRVFIASSLTDTGSNHGSTPANSWTTGIWHHVAFVYDGSGATNADKLKIYIDGVSQTLSFVGTIPASLQDSTAAVRLGDFENLSRFWNGYIDEVRISNAARSAEEIAEAWRAGRDHRLSRTITATDLSAKTKIPFFVAADRPGTLVETYVGETDHSVYGVDANTAGLWHLEEHAGSGAYIKDSSSNNNHGTPTGTTFTQGKIGRARTFDSSGDYASVASNATLNFGTGDFTVEAWVKTTSTELSETIVIKRTTAINAMWYMAMGPDGVGKVRWFTRNSGGTAVNVASNRTINDGAWHHVAGVRDAGSVKIYIDGVLDNTASGAAVNTDNTESLVIGEDIANGAATSWAGQIDEVRLSNTGRTADQIRMAYEYGRRTHQINVDFVTTAGTDGPTSTSDTQFTPDSTTGLYKGDTVIVREKVDATTYMMQGEVTSISAGLVTVASWTGTAPSGGYSTNADVFKWQREYWDVTDILAADRNAVVRLGLRVLDATEGFDIYLDDFRSNTNYLTTPGGSTITSSVNRYIQYRAILSTSDTAVTPQLTSVTINYTVNNPPNTPTLDSPANGATNITLTPQLKTTTTDTESDYLRYKIELCTNAAMTQNCQTFDQTASQTGWSGQNAQAGTAYTSGTQATYTVQTALSAGTTYYWRSYAIDPGGANSWSATQGTPNSFTTTQTPNAPSSLWTEGQTNPTQVTDTTPEFSAIYNDPDTGDIANYFQIQVNTQADFLGTAMWDSGQTSMTNCTAGTRCADISYAGSTLSWGATYYWKIRYWDQGGVVGPYSTESAYFTMSNFPPPTGCMIDDSAQPSQLIVKWTDNTTNESQFRLERNVNAAGFVFLTNKVADSTSHTDTTSAGNTYQYRVRAENANGNSDWCTTATVNLSTGTFNLQGVNVSGVTIK